MVGVIRDRMLCSRELSMSSLHQLISRILQCQTGSCESSKLVSSTSKNRKIRALYLPLVYFRVFGVHNQLQMYQASGTAATVQQNRWIRARGSTPLLSTLLGYIGLRAESHPHAGHRFIERAVSAPFYSRLGVHQPSGGAPYLRQRQRANAPLRRETNNKIWVDTDTRHPRSDPSRVYPPIPPVRLCLRTGTRLR